MEAAGKADFVVVHYNICEGRTRTVQALLRYLEQNIAAIAQNTFRVLPLKDFSSLQERIRALCEAVKKEIIQHPPIKEDKETIRDMGRICNLISEIFLNTFGRYPDILSIQELQYDRIGVPTDQFQTEGTNFKTFTTTMSTIYKAAGGTEARNLDAVSAFLPGNCGKNAKKDGDAYINSRFPSQEEMNCFGDPLFDQALLPSQYPIALAAEKFQEVRKISALKWKDFNPHVDFTGLTQANGKPIPEDTPLFDKGLILAKVLIQGRVCWVVNLHAMPNCPFGNPTSADMAWNKDQIAFLQYLTTGKTYFEVPQGLRDDGGKEIMPLDRSMPILALGDFNTDPAEKEGGGPLIRELFGQVDNNYPLINYKTEYSIGKEGPKELHLDYIMAQNLEFVSGRTGRVGYGAKSLAIFRSQASCGYL